MAYRKSYKKKYRKKRYYNNNNNGVQEYDIPTVIGILVVALGYYLKVFFESHPIISNIITIIVIIGIPIVIYLIIKNIITKKEKNFNIKTIDEMKKLHWREFEYFIEFVFRKKGFKAKVRQGSSDGGIDVDAELNGQQYLIQCKKWTNINVKVEKIREFFGVVCATERKSGKNTIGIFITTTRLTTDGQLFANENNIEVWDDSNLEKYIVEFTGGEIIKKRGLFKIGIDFMNKKNINNNKNKVLNIKQSVENQIIEEQIIENNNKEINNNTLNLICKKCGGNMVLRKAKRGDYKGNDFYGCENFPKCRNIINK